MNYLFDAVSRSDELQANIFIFSNGIIKALLLTLRSLGIVNVFFIYLKYNLRRTHNSSFLKKHKLYK